MNDMFGCTLKDLHDAKTYLEVNLKARTEAYYDAISYENMKRNWAEERAFDLLRIAIACIGKQIPKNVDQPLDVCELIEENCHLHDQVHNLALYLDYVKLHYPAAIGVMMQEYDGMPGYAPLSTNGGERNA